MEKQRFNLAILIPLLAIVLVATLAIVLGITFTQIYHSTGEIGVIIIGMSIVILIPVFAYLAEKKFNSTN
ncbi:MAG: hypothetical protein FI687_00325 [SAR202 cluster bacterium]|nr:hypothetical protein [SAR202 cluster bacterium]|tara:strand:- start:8075 stop:8284 length:210 start_codon:yes stop_codon:yes gene_type:complete